MAIHRVIQKMNIFYFCSGFNCVFAHFQIFNRRNAIAAYERRAIRV